MKSKDEKRFDKYVVIGTEISGARKTLIRAFINDLLSRQRKEIIQGAIDIIGDDVGDMSNLTVFEKYSGLISYLNRIKSY